MSLKLHTASVTSLYKEPNSLKQLQITAFSSNKNASFSVYDNNHVKPIFFPPTPKILTLEDDTGIESYRFDAIDDSQEMPSYEKIIIDKSPKNEVTVKLLSANPPSPNLVPQKQVFLTIDDHSAEFDAKISPKNGISTPTIIKELEQERLSSHESEVIQLADINQVETVVLEHIKPGTANIFGTTLVPSRFALDVMSKNGIRGLSNEPRSGDIKSLKSRVFSADEANQTIISPGIASPAASIVPKAKKKWRQLSHVLMSISLIQKQEVASITDKDVDFHIGTFQPRIQKEKFDILDRIYRVDGTREAFHTIRTIKMLCDCAAVGSPKYIAYMKEILDSDTRKNLYEPQDPDHLLNRYNTDGMPPLCIAAQNGNLEVVKFLIEKGADHMRETKITQKRKTKDVALELAVRWGHVKVVEYLLEKRVHPNQTLQSCLNNSQNKSITDLLINHMKSKNMNPKKKASCFGK